MNNFYADFNSKKKRGTLSLFLATFFLIAIRFLYFGFKYFPQLDDYIQHHNYALLGDFSYVINKLGLLAARPIAGILDITLWTWLWPCAIVGVMLLCGLFAFAAVEFYKIFEKLFGTSKFFIVFLTLFPLGIEGTYWMSASTRIIPGLLFAALSASYFLKFMEQGSRSEIVFAMLFQFLAFCFYEQCATLSCALNLILALIYLKNSNGRWIFSASFVFVGILYFLFTGIQSDSALYGSRTNLGRPINADYFTSFLPQLSSQIKTAFFDGAFYTFFYGFIRGTMRIISDGAWIYVALLVVTTIFFGTIVVSKNKFKEQRKFLLPLAISVILTVAPLAPFFIVANPWFSLRGTVPSFVGIALAVDVLIRLVTNSKAHRIAVFSSITAFVFCICSVSEIADYRDTTNADNKVVSAVSKIAPEIRKETTENCSVAVFNLDERYVTEQNFYYHEHIHGVTESDWALTGAVRCYNGDVYEGITYVPISLKDDPIYKKWEYGAKSIGIMQAVYVYDRDSNEVNRLEVRTVDNTFELYYVNGEKYGTVVENDGIGIFIEE